MQPRSEQSWPGESADLADDHSDPASEVEQPVGSRAALCLEAVAARCHRRSRLAAVGARSGSRRMARRQLLVLGRRPMKELM